MGLAHARPNYIARFMALSSTGGYCEDTTSSGWLIQVAPTWWCCLVVHKSHSSMDVQRSHRTDSLGTRLSLRAARVWFQDYRTDMRSCTGIMGGPYISAQTCNIIGASLSEPHTNGTSAARVCYLSYVRQRGPGGPIRHVWLRGAD